VSWGRHFDDLAAATSALLVDGPDAGQVTEPVTALAASDTVLVQLRQLVGAVCEAPRFWEVKPLLLTDIVDRPAKALHQALSALPRAVDFGASEMPDAVDLTLPAYEQHWQRAALAALALEKYVDPVGRLPDGVAWFVLRDLADLANALVYLDRDLSEAVLVRVKAGEDLAVQYAALTSTGHSVVRLAAGDIRGAGPGLRARHRTQRAAPAAGPAAAGELDQAIGRYLGNVTANAERLSVPNPAGDDSADRRCGSRARVLVDNPVTGPSRVPCCGPPAGGDLTIGRRRRPVRSRCRSEGRRPGDSGGASLGAWRRWRPRGADELSPGSGTAMSTTQPSPCPSSGPVSPPDAGSRPLRQACLLPAHRRLTTSPEDKITER
jgi:hypothetical protein